MKTSYVTIKAKDGSGDFRAYLSLPAANTAPAVVVIQEIFGVNRVMRDICDGLAQSGYMAICPDLFWRQEPGIDITDKTREEWAEAFELFKGFNVDKGVEDVTATLSFARAHESNSGKAGTLGYCLGGKLAFLSAARTDTDCSVCYYGVGIDELLGEAEKIKNQFLMHIAEKDKFVPEAAREKIMTMLGRNPKIEMYLYKDVDHAFAREGGEHWDAKAAAVANGRTGGFLAAHLK